MKKFSLYFFALILIISAIGHIMNPAFTDGFIPDFLPKQIVQIGTAIVEVCIGIGLLIPKFRHQAAWALLILMIAFLPIHIIDLFRDNPVIGSKIGAIIRVPFQLVFIYLSKKLTNDDVNR